MSKFNKYLDWLEAWLPGVWFNLAVFTITGLLIGSSIRVVQWILELVGVM